MHTSAFESCRIHHNSGYYGDIIITNMDSTSKVVIGEKTDIKFTAERLIALFKIHKKAMDSGLSPKTKTVRIEGYREDGYGSEIEILFSDIQCFVECVLDDEIKQKMEENEHSFETLNQIADILKINF